MSDPRQRLQERARSLGDLAGRVTDQRAIEGVEVVTLPIAILRRDGGTQARARLNPDMIQEYAEDMQRGDRFPPGVVFYDGQGYWLARGFTRVAAAEKKGETTYDFEVRQGTRRDAVLFSVGENAEHGQRRTNEDKRRAVMTLLEDPEWGQMSSEKIAEHCHVSHTFVNKIRPSLATVASQGEQGNRPSSDNTRVGADGRVYNVGRIQEKAEKRRAMAERKAARQAEESQPATPEPITPAASASPGGIIRDAVVEILRERGSLTGHELRMALEAQLGNLEANVFFGAISGLCSIGIIVPSARGTYSLPEPAPTEDKSDQVPSAQLVGDAYQDVNTGMQPEGFPASEEQELLGTTSATTWTGRAKIGRANRGTRTVVLDMVDDELLGQFVDHWLNGGGFVTLTVEFDE